MEMDTPVNVQVLKYEPLRQCALKVEVSRSTPHAPVQLFAKLRNDDRGLQLWKAFREIGAGKAEPGDFRLSRPVAYDERRRVLWHQWSEGQEFTAFAKRQGLIRACRKAAVALARFHQLEIAHLPSTTPEKNFRKLIERTNRMVQVHRQLKEPAQAVVLHLRQLPGFWHPAHQCPIHGDFNYSQLLFEGETPVLVDLDSACMGDPLYDVAHFVAGLYWLERRERFSLGDVQEAVYRFCETYRAGVPWEVPEDALHGQIALALVCRRAYKALRSLEPTMRDDMAYFLGLARHYLGKSTPYRTCAGQ
ncbi:MAG: hypothetical protein D6681_15200 [Calditrichaeota bacterium]|nr:MAG: hypothetical protein D6681_15200 [Calditrichota bacterium]